MASDTLLRKQLVEVLRGHGAHVDFEKAFAGLPAKLRGARAKNCPFTAWSLLEHMRIAQWDILEFSRDAKHVSPDWPTGYWPKSPAPPTKTAWNQAVRAF